MAKHIIADSNCGLDWLQDRIEAALAAVERETLERAAKLLRGKQHYMAADLVVSIQVTSGLDGSSGSTPASQKGVGEVPVRDRVISQGSDSSPTPLGAASPSTSSKEAEMKYVVIKNTCGGPIQIRECLLQPGDVKRIPFERFRDQDVCENWRRGFLNVLDWPKGHEPISYGESPSTYRLPQGDTTRGEATAARTQTVTDTTHLLRLLKDAGMALKSARNFASVPEYRNDQGCALGVIQEINEVLKPISEHMAAWESAPAVLSKVEQACIEKSHPHEGNCTLKADEFDRLAEAGEDMSKCFSLGDHACNTGDCPHWQELECSAEAWLDGFTCASDGFDRDDLKEAFVAGWKAKVSRPDSSGGDRG
jgi:hypothetical protein